MRSEKNYKHFVRGINSLLNARIESATRYQDKNVLLRHLSADNGRVRIQPTYYNTFLYPEAFIRLARKYQFSYYITSEPNLAGIEAPVIHFYPTEV